MNSRGGARKGAGRKPTGLKRNLSISFRVTQEERELVYKILDKLDKSRTEAFLTILKEYKEKIK